MTSTLAQPDAPAGFVAAPFVVVCDSREQCAYEFRGLKADAKDGGLPIRVETIVDGLHSGDYSIVGYESRIAIERKSYEDLFGTLGGGRARFERELERLNAMEWAAVVVEASWRDVAFYQPQHSRMSSKCVVRSIFAFSQRFPKVHWHMMGDRQLAEAATFRLLERFWRDDQDRKAAEGDR